MLAISSAQDFHAAVAAATEKPLVACFSAPWCGGCKLVAPKVEALAEELAATVSFAKVSAEELETLCEEVEVDSFPHFRVYKEGKILGDYTSSKFDKVDAFIRGLVAPETAKTEETPEVEASKETEADKTQGSKKRQEREEMEENDEHVAKKAKEETPKETEDVEKVEGAEKVDEVAEKEEAAEGEKETEKEDEAAPVDKLETNEATEAEADALPVDAAAA